MYLWIKQFFPIEEPSPLFYDSHIDYDILEYGCKGNKKWEYPCESFYFFLGNLLVTCRIIAIFLFVSEKMISFANYYIEFK